jgi:hypothetical protein
VFLRSAVVQLRWSAPVRRSCPGSHSRSSGSESGQGLDYAPCPVIVPWTAAHRKLPTIGPREHQAESARHQAPNQRRGAGAARNRLYRHGQLALTATTHGASQMSPPPFDTGIDTIVSAGGANLTKPRLQTQAGLRFRSWAHQDSNLGPKDYESSALTAELWARHRSSSAESI